MNIIVNIACGLANRMFQYSYYLYLQSKGYEVEADYYTSGVLAHEVVAWNKIFPKAIYRNAPKMKIWWVGGGESMIAKIRRRYFPRIAKVQYMPTAFSVELPKQDKQYMIGVFQNAEMVEAVRNEVLNKFSFKPFEDDYNREVAKEMAACESVAIHVRKGADYQSRIWYQNTCNMDYYRNAIAYMKNHLVNPRFFVFADNKEWVKEYFTGFEYTLVDGNPGDGWGSHFDMQLMSLCKHNIISNSTYSWWGAFLNASSKKVVIIPKVWFNPDSCDDFTSEKLLCKGWIQL